MNAPQNGSSYGLDKYGRVFVKSQFVDDGVHYVWFKHGDEMETLPLEQFNELKQ